MAKTRSDTFTNQMSRESTGRPTFTLFRIAYDRIWKNRSLQVWELLAWLPLATNVGFGMEGYNYTSMTRTLCHVSALILQFLPPLTVVSWVNTVHASQGRIDESIQTVPVTPSQVVWSRFLAVLLTCLQIYGPLILTIFVYHLHSGSYFELAGYNSHYYESRILIPVGWIMLLAGWGMLSGSIAINRGFSYLFWYWAPAVLVILVIGALLLFDVYFHKEWLWVAFTWDLFPRAFKIVGNTGLVLSPFLVWCASHVWGKRT